MLKSIAGAKIRYLQQVMKQVKPVSIAILYRDRPEKHLAPPMVILVLAPVLIWISAPISFVISLMRAGCASPAGLKGRNLVTAGHPAS
jgi:hypothetical protein